VVADSEGIAVALDTAMQAAVAATYDPWKEATAPKTANQFVTVIATGDG
jgi:nitrite reductase (NADH) large subunit